MKNFKELVGELVFQVVKSCIIHRLVELREKKLRSITTIKTREKESRDLKQFYFTAATALEQAHYQSKRIAVSKVLAKENKVYKNLKEQFKDINTTIDSLGIKLNP